MLYIDDELPNIRRAKETHIHRMYCYTNRKINGNGTFCGDKSCNVCRSGIEAANISNYLRSTLRTIDLKKIIGSSPVDLLQINNEFNTLYNAHTPPTRALDQTAIASIFNYKWFSSSNGIYDAYELCKQIGTGTCVYCNRLYTTTAYTEEGNHIIRPTLDHWFPKSDYPILAISFYNLIPSCTPCNSSVKHRIQFSLTDHIHPYLSKEITRRYNMRSIYDTRLNSFKITIDTKDNNIASSLKAMKIADIYQYHQSELKDLELLKQKYNRTYLQHLGKLLDTSLTEKDAYRIMFGVEYEDEDFHKRPLSKLKKDILNFKIT